MNNIVELKGAREAPRSERSSMETLIVSIEQVQKWHVPPFQRPLRINSKIQAMAEEVKQGEAVPGVITLGRLGKAGDLYIVDGQHRLEAFKISGLSEVIVDVRIVHFGSMSEMAEEFVELNSALVRMRPDDVLRGLEPTSRQMQRIRSECGYVGYDQIRRGTTTSTPIVGMSQLLRCWSGSANETPANNSSGRSAATIATEMGQQAADELIRFLHLAFGAWGREPEYYRLWAGLNLTMCMWLYRRLVLDRTRGVKRFVVLNEAQFRQCLTALSADQTYVEFLHGRMLTERDRSPTYSHLRRIFVKRLQTEGNPRPLFPQPVWASNSGTRS